MATLVREVKLICADIGENNNKYWFGRLFDDDTIEYEYGRVDVTKTTGTHPASKGGERKFESIIKAKKKGKTGKPGYTELKVVSGSVDAKTSTVVKGSLGNIAKTQIETGCSVADSLVTKLVKWNIHQITSSTSITFNDATGLFQTPLGVVSQDAIDDARSELLVIQDQVKGEKWDHKKTRTAVNSYLRLIPQAVGMGKFNAQSLFPDNQAVKNQNDILVSLEASLEAMAKTPDAKSDKDKKEIVEKVFDVKMSAIADKDKEFARINKWFNKTASSNHSCYGMKMNKLYNLSLGFVDEEFEKVGRKVGNIMELWHGTNKANLLSIMKSGLRCAPPNTAAIAGKMFGNGIYFSDQSTKSLNYAYGYWSGNRETNCFMLVCEVAMGKYHVPSGSGRHFPVKGSDSTFAKARQSSVMNNEMIVYKNGQQRVKYLVEFVK